MEGSQTSPICLLVTANYGASVEIKKNYIYIYIYIYVCVCVCGRARAAEPLVPEPSALEVELAIEK